MAGKKKRVLVGGTFEYLHSGHIAFLKAASAHGKLFVVVARDGNSARIRGRKPVVPEKLRLAQMKSLKLVERAFLGGKNGLLDGIRRAKPDLIFLGPDQLGTGKLRKILRGENGLDGMEILRMRARVGREQSSRKLLRRLLSD
ncbi:MAG: adenylyltransferase/cytidyltransferase family protein [archaeon]